jgi:carbonic anhydrase
MLTFRDEELRERLRKETGAAPETPRRFYAFSDIEENVRRQIQAAREHPWILAGITIRGCVYDVRTGSLREVEATFAHRSAKARTTEN